MNFKKTHVSQGLLQKRRNKVINKKDRVVVIFNKPFHVLCQFTDESNKQRQTLADYIPIKEVYPAGRLDYDSEGLLILTNDGKFQARISQPKFKTHKIYYVQVDGEVSPEAIKQLVKGVKLKDGMTKPALVETVAEPQWLWPRTPPIRVRKEIPTSWIKLTITEGRNRQVRRMTAAVGFPTLRLIRYAIGDWTLEGLDIGEYRKI